MLYETDQAAKGHAAISQAVTDLLSHMPPDFAFHAIRPALGHHGIDRLQWQGGAAGAPPIVTGLDVAHVASGLIQTLHVFIDQPAESS